MKSERWHLQSLPRRIYTKLFQISLLGLVIILLGAGFAVFSHVYQGNEVSHASDLSVIGQPSLSASTVDSIFSQMGSPMVGMGKVVEATSRQANIDDAFALGVWWTETNDGAAGVGSADRNPGSVRASPGYPAAYDGYTIYPSYSVAILDWFSILRNRYTSRGLTTVYAIADPYVGTSSSPLWAGKVTALIERYRGIAPPPLPSAPQPKPSPIATPIKQGHIAIPTPLSSTYVQRQVQTLPKSTVAQRSAPLHSPVALQLTSASLSPSLKLGLVVFGLLAALVIALWGLLLGRTTPQAQSRATPATQPGEMLTPILAMDLPPFPVPTEPLDQSSAWPDWFPTPSLNDIHQDEEKTKFPVRRVVLLPSLSNATLEGEGRSTSTGLLTRYGK